MATYKTIRQGSKGEDVKTWQTYLKSQGYDVGSSGVDGIYGTATYNATKQYQKDNGLAVDGIVGENTWGSINTKTTNNTNKTKTTTTPKNTTSTTTQKEFKYDDFTYDNFKPSEAVTSADKNRQKLASSKPSDFTYEAYEKSDVVKQAEALVQQQIASKPGEYQSNWQTQLDETLNKILNREKFTYDLNGDALYQQYKDQYMLQGQQAMMDAMGQAQAMTGGYGNSYAQTVGQQTYQGYLQQLNDKVPELYQLALDQYNREKDELYNQYGLFADRENTDYGRYRDTVSDYYTELNYLTENARYMSEDEYNKYMDDINMKYSMHRDDVTDWQKALDRADSEYWNMIGFERDNYNTDRNFAYGQYADDKNFDYGQYIDTRNYNYQLERDAITDALNEREMKLAEEQLALQEKKGTKGSNTKKEDAPTGGNGYDNGSHDPEVVKQAQKYVGASADGKWGSNSSAKAKAKGYNSLDEVVAAMGGGLNASDYEGWTALDWNSYFAQIRQTEGKSAAEMELEEFTKQGIIPKKYLASAGVGARGSLGH